MCKVSLGAMCRPVEFPIFQKATHEFRGMRKIVIEGVGRMGRESEHDVLLDKQD